jgi:hypothetical protein
MLLSIGDKLGPDEIFAQIGNNGGAAPAWAPNGRELLYL